MVNRSELKKMLPHGSNKMIAEKANVSAIAVTRYFKNDFNSEKIEIAALEVAALAMDKKKSLMKSLNLI